MDMSHPQKKSYLLLVKLNLGFLLFDLRLSLIPEIKVIGSPLMSVVAFTTRDSSLNIFSIGDLLSLKGWKLNVLQFPSAIHIANTLLTSESPLDIVNDVKECVKQLIDNPALGNGGYAAIYGTSASIADRTVIEDVSFGFLDGLTKYKENEENIKKDDLKEEI